ncbi:hypothetical protein GCM10008959_34490 [Deinococcus seoulensis]|uniref:ABC transporter domain-containing protein n=1 Tax=Deinococcus seoulensis TaxID=1837379 RepID=A0ABQ2RXG6_9DEIO|nr:ATP-binding cassette domain-containing protein [Deinococcus seoulensis]GGR69684.1 hypothetical protein GCM10008959_34490 [Deinococcus seoulensis]
MPLPAPAPTGSDRTDADPARPPLTLPDLTLCVAGRPLATLRGLTLRPGDVLHLQGPNGAGKTTLLRALAGEQPGAEAARIVSCAPGSLPARAATAWVPTDAPLPDDLSAGEFLHFTAALWSRPVAPLLTLAGALGLERWLDAWPQELSRGTRQKVVLSAALGLELPLTLLDEPFGTLDAASRAALLAAVQARAAAGGALIVTTHGAELAPLHPRTLTLAPA